MNNPPVIVIVDDMPDNLSLLEAILTPEGYEVIKCQSGTEAIQIIDSRTVDLVLLDVLMPEIDGFEVCNWIRSKIKTRFLPVIMITALTEVEDRIKGLDAGADDFISKPFNDSLLLAKVRSLLKLKSMRDELEEVKRDFSNMMVHDIRSPIHSILGIVDLLEEDLPHDHNYIRLLEMIRKSAEKIDRMITELLAWSKLESGELKLETSYIDIVSFVRDTVEQLKPMGKWKKIQFNFSSPFEELYVNIDGKRFDQVLSNLVQNAVKYSPLGGMIDLSLEKKDNKLIIFVDDQGPGIEEAERNIIFERFTQAKNHIDGVGIGLYVCRTIIEAHGGKIYADTSPSGGARFVIEIPINTKNGSSMDRKKEND